MGVSRLRINSLLQTVSLFFFFLGFVHLYTSHCKKWRCTCSILSKKAKMEGGKKRWNFAHKLSQFIWHVVKQSDKWDSRFEKQTQQCHTQIIGWLWKQSCSARGTSHDSCWHVTNTCSKDRINQTRISFKTFTNKSFQLYEKFKDCKIRQIKEQTCYTDAFSKSVNVTLSLSLVNKPCDEVWNKYLLDSFYGRMTSHQISTCSVFMWYIHSLMILSNSNPVSTFVNQKSITVEMTISS